MKNIARFDDHVKVGFYNWEDYTFEFEDDFDEYSFHAYPFEWYAYGVDISTGKICVCAWVECDGYSDGFHIAETLADPEDINWEPEQNSEEVVEDLTDEYEEPVYVINRDSVSLTYKDNVYSTNNSNKDFGQIVQHILAENYEEAIKLFSPVAAIESWVEGLLEVRNDKIYYDGFEIKGKFIDKIINYAKNDYEVSGFLKFLKLTMEQEDVEVRNRLLDFAADDTIDFSSDGYVIAYKNVRDDYYDKHSGKFRNQVGDKPSVPRSSVDADHNTTCSTGLHVCSFKYLMRCWGTSNRNMIVYVNPKDFVAIPYDYDDSKARVCQYEVVSEMSDEHLQRLISEHNM